MARIIRTTVPAAVLLAIVVSALWPIATAAQHRGRVHVVYGYGYPYHWYYPYYPGWWGPWGYGPYVYPYIDYGVSSLRVQTQPETAEVFVDGYRAGVVDEFNGIFQRLQVTPGGHEIAVYHPDYQTFRRQLYLRPAGDQSLKIALAPLQPGETAEMPMPAPEPATPPAQPERQAPVEPEPQVERAPRLGTLVVRGVPAGAELVVDGQAVEWNGTTTPVTLELTEGRHTLEVRAGAVRPFVQDVLIRRDRRLEVTARFDVP